jgi:hypothetical protein
MTYKSPLARRPLRPALRCGFVQDRTGLAWMVWQPGRPRWDGRVKITHGRPLVRVAVPRCLTKPAHA